MRGIPVYRHRPPPVIIYFSQFESYKTFFDVEKVCHTIPKSDLLRFEIRGFIEFLAFHHVLEIEVRFEMF